MVKSYQRQNKYLRKTNLVEMGFKKKGVFQTILCGMRVSLIQVSNRLKESTGRKNDQGGLVL